MEREYWNHLQPFVKEDWPVDQGHFDDLRALYLALQCSLHEARRLGDQIAGELKRLGLPSPPDPS